MPMRKPPEASPLRLRSSLPISMECTPWRSAPPGPACARSGLLGVSGSVGTHPSDCVEGLRPQ
eukprot:361590-Alexandrium_andersonii.AAC.1